MSGIFGAITKGSIEKNDFNFIANHSNQRGKDVSGLVYIKDNTYQICRTDSSVTQLLRKTDPYKSSFVMGYNNVLVDNNYDNQPIERDGICLINGGEVLNQDELWKLINQKKNSESDSEIIAALTKYYSEKGEDIEAIPEKILKHCKGIIACSMILPKSGKLLLFSNNGSLYVGKKEDAIYFASENYSLQEVNCEEIIQVKDVKIFDIEISDKNISIQDNFTKKRGLTCHKPFILSEEKLLEYSIPNIKRCTKCILPETMPYINFDEKGVCNYCRSYKLRNVPRPKKELFDIVESYRREKGNDCIVPFSGGRDSCYGLHLIIKELGLKPITYTYDWGMITDLGKRNISRMSAELGVENIVIAADIRKKRENIRKNLQAWLKSPHLGMINILSAGDKHFFKYVETVKKQTGIQLNLWGVNPLEVTHFKAGFLGVPPNFEEKKVYSSGALKQMRYQYLRLKAMTESPGYFNSSMWDTLSGEYYRSFTKKSDYFHIFDFWQWDEETVNNVLDLYNWEKAPDTSTTWRIGDGTGAFFDYVYHTVAGFTEHDTFRSNQIREGQMTRERALELVADENQPRYQTIRWYLDAVGVDFEKAIKIINRIPKLYNL